MNSKPKGAKYRNLYAWRGLIWYSRMVRARRMLDAAAAIVAGPC